jgi:hypothetical protein
MSKKVAFPVMSAMITGILYIIALLLGSLTILVSGLGLGSTGALVNALLFFIAAFLAGWALLSFAFHPGLDANQRLVAAIFTGLLLLVFFNAGTSFLLTF